MELQRKILKYARETGIRFRQTGRFDHSKPLSIPDMRGFSPHLRTVNLNLNQKPDLWVLHDILHIMFYDFASFHLGKNLWAEESRFYENHLASEAFAVLVLDYHYLSFKKSGGLAVDINAKKWSTYQKLNPDLPDFLSSEFCDLHMALYLSGDTEKLEIKKGKSVSYGNWLGHEVRYSEKQRYYVKMWRCDLNQISKTGPSVLIQDSAVSEAVWELTNLLLYAPTKYWNDWIKRVGKLDDQLNYFAGFEKFKSVSPKLDFRFSDSQSVTKSRIQECLRIAVKPSGSNLFLLWQLISQIKLAAIPLQMRVKIRKLAVSSQTDKVDKKTWGEVKDFCLANIQRSKGLTRLRGNFFMP